MSPKLKKIIAIPIVLSIAIVLAYFIGISVGEAFNESKHENRKIARRMRTIQLLEQMGSVNIGDTISVTELSKLKSREQGIGKNLSPKTVLLFVDPGCEQCITELKDLKNYTKNKRFLKYFIAITNNSPDLLYDLLDEIGVACPVLFDETGSFTGDLGVFTYPFNIYVNPSLEIVNIIAGNLTEEDIEDIVDYNENN